MKALLVFVFGVGLFSVLVTPGQENQGTLSKMPLHSFTLVDTVVPVKVQMEQTTMGDMFVVFIRDTAATTGSMNEVFNRDYGELMQFIRENNLRPLKFMAWYYSMQPPWPIEIAVETHQLPPKLTGRIQSRTQKGGAVLIAHVWGPYDQVGHGYAEIQKFLATSHLRAKSAPFEVYVTDPSNSKDPSEIQTDVYQPVE